MSFLVVLKCEKNSQKILRLYWLRMRLVKKTDLRNRQILLKQEFD